MSLPCHRCVVYFCMRLQIEAVRIIILKRISPTPPRKPPLSIPQVPLSLSTLNHLAHKEAKSIIYYLFIRTSHLCLQHSFPATLAYQPHSHCMCSLSFKVLGFNLDVLEPLSSCCFLSFWLLLSFFYHKPSQNSWTFPSTSKQLNQPQSTLFLTNTSSIYGLSTKEQHTTLT